MYARSASGEDAAVLNGANGPELARTCSGSASANEPFTSRPGAVALGSATDRVASPAVDMTVAVVLGLDSCDSTPGVNVPNEAGAPSDSDSVAGTEPPTLPVAHGLGVVVQREDDRFSGGDRDRQRSAVRSWSAVGSRPGKVPSAATA